MRRQVAREYRLGIWLLFAALKVCVWPLQPSWGDEGSGLSAEVVGWRGTVAAAGGGDVPEEVLGLIRRAAGEGGSVLIVSGAAEDRAAAAESAERWLREGGLSQVVSDLALESTSGREGVLRQIESATAVWICGGQQGRLAESWHGSGMEAGLRALLSRGGFVGGTSAGAAILSKVMIQSGTSEPEIGEGWDVISGVVIDQHFSERKRSGRLEEAVRRNAGLVGLGVDEGTAAVIEGRRLSVVGSGSVSVVTCECAYREDRIQRLLAGGVADLTQYRRAARQRVTGMDPGRTSVGRVGVESGSLVIVGGGLMPADVVKRFVDLAGGANGHVVVLPTAVYPSETDRRVPGFLAQAGLRRISVLDQRGQLADTKEFREVLEDATGIWFGGGRQWHFVDAYEGTGALELFQGVLKRGGVIGGSSAGATIQGEFLVRGSPLGNTVMMAEGYERGFGFLPGTAIDQHFSQRGRQVDLLGVIRQHRGLLGIGLDEGTAIVVRGGRAEVAGLHAAHFLSARQLESTGAIETPYELEEAKKLYVSVASGGAIDLTTLKVEGE